MFSSCGPAISVLSTRPLIQEFKPNKKKMKKSTTGKRRVTFKIVAPGATEVSVAGTFNDWDQASHPLKKGKGKGVYTRMMYLPKGDHEYKYSVDGEWILDPDSETIANSFGTENNILHLT